jgi:uncharacterized protein (DUF433 family)
MTVATTYPHITKPADGPAHLTRVPRVRVAQIIMDQKAYGWSTEEICRQHPGYEPAEIHMAFAYYYDHQDEIDREIESEWEEVRRTMADRPPSPMLQRFRAQGLR